MLVVESEWVHEISIGSLRDIRLWLSLFALLQRSPEQVMALSGGAVPGNVMPLSGAAYQVPTITALEHEVHILRSQVCSLLASSQRRFEPVQAQAGEQGQPKHAQVPKRTRASSPSADHEGQVAQLFAELTQLVAKLDYVSEKIRMMELRLMGLNMKPHETIRHIMAALEDHMGLLYQFVPNQR